MKGSLKQQILSAVEEDLAVIEENISKNLTPYLERIREIASHILFGGGKRLRPLLMLLSARICNYQGNYAETFSVIFEYLHTATLLHDDLVDEADFRRGRPVANAVWDNPSAVLVGDFLLARSSSIAVKAEKFEILEVLAGIMEDMAQGELHQLTKKGDPDLSEDEYLQIIRNKTAVLMAGACRSGAVLADAPPAEQKALEDYGLNFGMGFQMADDLLDYTADPKTLGKSVGADLREGKYTLPLIHALARATDEDRREIKKIMNNPAFSREEFSRLNKLLEKYSGIEYTRQCAANYIDQAKTALSVFSSSKDKNLLVLLADYAIERSS